MQNPYHVIFIKIFGPARCGTPFIQMAKAERRAYLALSKEDKLKYLEEKEAYEKRENILNVIRLILLILIIIGIILLCTQRFWVDSFVNFILKHSN